MIIRRPQRPGDRSFRRSMRAVHRGWRCPAWWVSCAALLAIACIHVAPRGELNSNIPCLTVSSREWDIMDARARSKELTSESEKLSTQGYTVLLNTFKRRDLLKRAVQHYSKCPGVQSVRVIWSEQVAAPTESDGDSGGYFFLPKPGMVQYRSHNTTSIQNRFEPWDNIKTRAVFNVDDDVQVPCKTLFKVFNKWKRNKDALVGFYARSHAPAKKPHDGCTWRYVQSFETQRRRRFSIVLTKAAFMDQKYLSLYKEKLPNGVREYIDERKNCEDIAMQFLVSAITNEPPEYSRTTLFYYLLSKVSDIGLTGISSGSDHGAVRGRCITDFRKFFGGLRLVEKWM